MAFSNPVDYVGISDSALVLVSSNENRTAQTAEANDEKGDIIARDVYGENATPNSEYKLAANLSKAISLGTVTTVGTDKVVLKSLTIKTSSGAAPVITANGETIQATGTVSGTVVLGTVVCSARHKAQILGEAFTLSGDGCSLNECTIVYECNLTKATKEGDVISHDCSGGKATVTATIVQSGSAVPVITPDDDWDMTDPLSVSGPDGDYETWTVKLTKSLVSSAPA